MLNADPKGISGCSGDNEYFRELCAVATAGTLTDGESEELKIHLGTCDRCRKLIQEYREVARTGMAMLMPELTDESQTPEKSWVSSEAKQILFARIAAEQQTFPKSRECDEVETGTNRSKTWHWLSGGWRGLHPAVRYASLSFLLATAILAVYQTGKRTGGWAGTEKSKRGESANPAIAESDVQKTQLNRLMNQRAGLEESLKAQSTELSELSEQLKIQESEIAKWKGLQGKAERDLYENAAALADIQSRYAAAVANGDVLSRQLQESKAGLQETQSHADALRNQNSMDAMSIANLESRIEDLSGRLKDSETAFQEQQQLLSHDRDIRELMGARKLYIADVYDFTGNGDTQVPYGRVFYTTGKSLIFYAFDLDQQPNLRKASIFQAWGRRGNTDQRPLNMGIFYLDNAANNRWVLKFDDPKALAQIDAVFVTVEPHTGSQKPSGKQLMFASLRMVASNHP
jgi:hypothetical protein